MGPDEFMDVVAIYTWRAPGGAVQVKARPCVPVAKGASYGEQAMVVEACDEERAEISWLHGTLNTETGIRRAIEWAPLLTDEDRATWGRVLGKPLPREPDVLLAAIVLPPSHDGAWEGKTLPGRGWPYVMGQAHGVAVINRVWARAPMDEGRAP